MVKLIEKGVFFWCCNWSKYGVVKNYVIGYFYMGINVILMNFIEYFIFFFMSFK